MLTIGGVKYKPKAPPMTHCAVLRSGVQLAVGPPVIETIAVASSGPIIHGNGTFKETQAKAAAQAQSNVISVRTSCRTKSC
jgi:hypothetical protein